MAQEVNLGGTIYISSKRAAEITGYAQDYIGQLARAGHIDARRVSGMWYVLEDSVRKHKDKRDNPTLEPEANMENPAPASIQDPASDFSNFAADIDFDGKSYISAARAADTTGYSHDYVTQLARGSKVPAHQIGSRWYVERDALIDHKTEKDSLLAAVQSDSVGLAHRVEVSAESETPELQVSEPHFTYKSEGSADLLPTLPDRATTKEELEREVGLGGIGMDDDNAARADDEENQIRIRVVPEKINQSDMRSAHTEDAYINDARDEQREYYSAPTPSQSRSAKMMVSPKLITFGIVFVGIVASGVGAYIYMDRTAHFAIPTPTRAQSAIIDMPVSSASSSITALAERVFAKELEYKRKR